MEKFIHSLRDSNGAQPALTVEPEGMNDAEPSASTAPVMDESEDPLLELFHRKTDLTAEGFLSELRRQRDSAPDRARAEATV